MRLGNLLLLVLCFFTAMTQASDLPKVVVTIKPIHALATGVMVDVAEPYLLLQGGESPHSYSMKPSQIKELSDADLVIWVGQELETFLEKTIAGLDTQVLTVLEEGKNPLSNNQLKLFTAREGHDWEHHHTDEHGNEESHGSDYDGKSIDAHIWLDPLNAIVIVKMIVAKLSKIDTIHAVRYQTNADLLIERLEQLDQELKTQLSSVKMKPFVVFHDAYQYVERRYALNAVGAVSLSPERSPSAKQLHHLREVIEEKQVHCIFIEPQFPPTLVNTLMEETAVQQGILDPLGSELTVGTESYFDLLHNIALSLTTCLSK